MELLARHLVLATAWTREECRTHVLDFFKQTALVRYDRVEIVDDSSVCATDPVFKSRLEDGLEKNRQTLSGFIEELGGAGFENRNDISTLEQGYPSKIFHIIAHFLDGFIGIDTRFYNLVDDSHWVKDETVSRIEVNPEQFWLFSLECYSMSPKEAALLHM